MEPPVPDPDRPPQPAIAAILSALVPGAGQLYAGERRRGLILLAITGVLAILAIVLWLQGKVFLAKQVFKPTVLGGILAADVVLLGFRAFSAYDAWKLAAREHEETPAYGRVWLATALTITGLILVVPHAVVAYYDLLQYDLITTVFADDDPIVADPTTTTTSTTIPASTSTTSGSATTQGSTTTTAPPTTTTTTLPPRLWDGKERLNLLLLGGDAGPGRTGVRTDTIMVASVDPETGDAALFGIPRNLIQVPLPEDLNIWRCDCYPQIINELYAYGVRNPEAFPGGSSPGGNAIMTGVSELLGIDIHFYALVSLQGFVDLVDALGGVELTVVERVYDATYPHEDGGTEVIDIKPGTHQMDGHTALAYARSRHGSDDYNRMGRQGCVIEATLEQASPADLLLGFPRLAESLKANLETDIPLDAVPDLIELLGEVDTDRVVSIRFIRPTYSSHFSGAGYPVPATDLIREHVSIVMELPAEEAMAVLGIDPLDDACADL
jgi:LCP family protein required for cell wall assembly